VTDYENDFSPQGSIGTVLFVQIGSALTKGGPGRVLGSYVCENNLTPRFTQGVCSLPLPSGQHSS
jgi:hypothetical protein